MFKLKFSIVIVLLLPCFTALAQRYNFTTYTVANGLPNNQINDLLQDRRGRLWIGTNNGVCRYNGRAFNKFEQENPVSNNPVKSIYEDRDGNIWMGTVRKGVCRFDGTESKFFTIEDGLLSNIIYAITQDLNGNMWFGTSEGLCRYNGKSFINYTTLRGLTGNDITALMTDKGGNVWIGTLSGLIKFDGKEFKNYTVSDGLAGNLIYSITQTQDFKIYVGTNNGVSVFDGWHFTNYNTESTLGGQKITGIVQDYKGNKWFASNGSGIYEMDEGRFKPYTIDQGLPSNGVMALLEDREGNIWLGTDDGLCRYGGDRFVTFTTDDGLSNNKIISVYSDLHDNMWFSTITGGVNFYDGIIMNTLDASLFRNSTVWCIRQTSDSLYWFGTTNGAARYNFNTKEVLFPFPLLDNQVVYSIIEDKKGALYFGTDKGIYIFRNNSFTHIDKTNGLNNESVRVLFEDSNGLIWVGTMQGVYFLNGLKAEIINTAFNLVKAPVTSIIEDFKGNLIFSTFDFGLYIFNRTGNKKSIAEINANSGISNNRLLFCFLDRNAYMWLGTPEGLDRIDWNTYLKRNYVNNTHFDKSNGYLGVESNAAASDKESNVWFGTANGAIRFNPKSGYSKVSIPIVNLNKIEFFFKPAEWNKLGLQVNHSTGLPDNPVLGYGNNNMQFYFTGIYLTAPDEVQYRWKLDGFDDYWSPPTKFTVANYSNIPPGDYTFKVHATANGRDWSGDTTYSFSIKPPLWRTNIFYFIYFLSGIGLIFLIMRLRTRNLRKSQLMLRQRVNERTKELNEKNIELAKLSIVASETGNAVMIFNNKMELEWVNEGFTKITGYTKEEFTASRGIHIRDLTNNSNIDRIIKDCIREKQSFIYESEMTTKDNRKIWMSSTLTPVFDANGSLKNIVVIDSDITLRKKMEEQIRESLEEKGLLLKEIHHRVKNNLQIIISLFNLQSNYVHDANASKALKEGQDRIKSMALIHERFYQAEGTSRIDFDEYINRLCESLQHSSGISTEKVKMEIDSEKISLDIDTAVPCGLIINELVSNAFKHAFTGKEKGIIKVTFGVNGNQTYKLVVSDNGVGLPKGMDFYSADTLGLQLIQALADQIEAKVSVNTVNGLTVTVDFKR